MRIGLFSDSYLPSINGISYVLQIMHDQLTELGHEVFIFAPATNLRGQEPNDPDYVYRFPAIEGIFFDDYLLSIFFPPAAYRRIKKLDLDVIHYFTPSQIGLMGMYVAIREDIPLVGQYSTDLFQYVEKYPLVLPGTIALSMYAPFVLKLTPREVVRSMRALKPHYSVTKWHKQMIARMHRVLHDRCDAVIALSPKMKELLDSWGCEEETILLPTGVDPIPPANKQAPASFRKTHGIPSDHKVLLYSGRLSREKNLELLVDMFDEVAESHTNVTLLLAGDGDYRKELESLAEESRYADRIVFSGRYKREDAGAVYGAADIFVFPSVTDTQGLVVNEAAGTGLPLIMCDDEVSEVFTHGKTGLLSHNNPMDYANQVIKLLDDHELCKKLGQEAKKTAARYSERGQMLKMEQIYKDCIANHISR